METENICKEHYDAMMSCLPVSGRHLTVSAEFWLELADLIKSSRVYKTGEWKETERYPKWVYCSVCNKKFLPSGEWIKNFGIPTNFCPNCGADNGGLK